MQVLQGIGPASVILWGLSVLGAYYVLEQLARRLRPRRFRPYAISGGTIGGIADSAEQLRVVMRSPFTAKRIMSFAEYQVFKEVEAEIRAATRGYRVFAQTSLGEVLGSEDKRAYGAINSKRVDVLVISASGLPLVAIEHQGRGHYQGDAAARDAVKKEALRKAGVAYVEVFDTHTPEQIRTAVREALARSEPDRQIVTVGNRTSAA